MRSGNSKIDIKESLLRRTGNLLDILLMDRTSKKNIYWATDSYESLGKSFSATNQIKPELVTGVHYKLIQPRAAKSLSEQKQRTKEKAEVFTPLKIVDQMNRAIDTYMPKKANWKDYVTDLKLEITCGEAPFIVNRYNPTSNTGKLIKLNHRVGFLDKKLKIISKYCNESNEWLRWASEAFKSSYGYEWQGDNVLLARENLLYTLIDFYEAKFKKKPALKVQEDFAEIISWNIFQMDGIKYVIPMSCHYERKELPIQPTLFGEIPKKVKRNCEGCVNGRPFKHNGKYVQIMDWKKNKKIKFIELLK